MQFDSRMPSSNGFLFGELHFREDENSHAFEEDPYPGIATRLGNIFDKATSLAAELVEPENRKLIAKRLPPNRISYHDLPTIAPMEGIVDFIERISIKLEALVNLQRQKDLADQGCLALGELKVIDEPRDVGRLKKPKELIFRCAENTELVFEKEISIESLSRDFDSYLLRQRIKGCFIFHRKHAIFKFLSYSHAVALNELSRYIKIDKKIGVEVSVACQMIETFIENVDNDDFIEGSAFLRFDLIEEVSSDSEEVVDEEEELYNNNLIEEGSLLFVGALEESEYFHEDLSDSKDFEDRHIKFALRYLKVVLQMPEYQSNLEKFIKEVTDNSEKF